MKNSKNNLYKKIKNKSLKIKLLAYFWRYCALVLILLSFFIVANITKSEAITFFVLGTLIALYGAYLFIGYLLKFKHIYCFMQDAHHNELTPFSINWNDYSKKDYIGVPLIFIFFGIFAIIVSFFV